jgi:tetratricopeptide (TPR) repeat protein
MDSPSSNPDSPTLGDASSPTAASAGRALNMGAILEVGTLLGGRYEIQEILGLGGMGAVYKAHDRDINQTVALKVIRPDLAQNPEIVERFKQELLLARQIAHKNIIRIFDVRESGGIKFITMEHIVGRDLHRLLADRGKLLPEEALDIIEQVCAGLAAAHGEGVIHRDLKPSNIMLDMNGRVVVMDFGIARTVKGGGMTQTGAMLGTIEYMSPEQAKAEALDGRSDLFTVGLILYEMLTGEIPFKADTALASLLKRTQERAVPPSELVPSIPKSLSAIVSKCVETDPKQRYQTMEELITALDEVRGRRPESVFVPQPAAITRKHWIGMSAAALVVAVALAIGGIWFLRPHGTSSPLEHKNVTVLLADFQNSTADPVFDGTLESSFGLAIEGAPFISAYNRAQARKTAAQLKPGATLDEENARLVAVREGINVVISGGVEKSGDGYKISCKTVDAVTGKVVGNEAVTAKAKDGVLQAVGSLAAKVRGVLGDTTPESAKLARAETFTTGNLEAAHEYGRAQELRYAGKSADAIQAFLKAIQLDPNFGSAYAGVAAMYANQGHRDDAINYYKQAMQHVDNMTDREKYRTRGGFYLASMDPQKAVDEFSTLVQQFPADIMGRNSLAFAYYLRHDMTHALEEGRKAVAEYPKNVPYRNNVALYAIYAGDFATAQKEGQAAMEMNPAYEKAYISVALSELAQGHPETAIQTYQKLQGVSAQGASFASNGMADLALYQSRPAEAIAALEKGIAQNMGEQKADAAAKKYTMLAEAQLMLGQNSQAVTSLDKAVSLSKQDVLFPAARLYVEAGQDQKATALAATLAQQLEPGNQAYAKLIDGDIQLKHGHAKEAIKLFMESQAISDTWLGHFDLARGYVDAGAFTQADSELSACLKRRGESTDVYSDEVQTFHYFPAVYFYLGREREGLKSSGAAEAYNNFLALKTTDAQDPMVADARKRAK